MSSSLPVIDANTVFGSWPSRQVDLSPETLLDTMKKNNVARSLCVSTTGILYDYRQGNDESLAMGKQHPELFPMATVDPRQHLDCLSEIDKRVGQGFKIFRLYPEHQGWPIRFAPLRDLLGKLGESRVPVQLSCGNLGDATAVGEMLRELPTRVILSGVYYANLGEAISVMKSQPTLWIETHMLNSADAFEVLANEVGTERLIFGSYAPLKYLSSALMPVLSSGLSDEQKTQVLSGNIRQLLTAG